jgi:hypothetical protein
MAHTLLLHVANEDPIVIETEALPDANATLIIGLNPRRKDNKELTNIMPEVTTVIFPMWRINFIEVMPSGEEEELFRPFRD